MKKLIALSFLFFSINSMTVFSQIRIGGGVSIDINLPIPDVVIVDRPTRRVPEPAPRRKPRVEKRRKACNQCHRDRTYSYGEIQNQNGPFGRQIFSVVDAHLEPLQNRTEVVSYQLDSGDVLELFIVTENPNDYNYHVYRDNYRCENNRIIKVLFNGDYLDLEDGNLSLQPRGRNGFHSVINLHSIYEGDFNGSVNF